MREERTKAIEDLKATQDEILEKMWKLDCDTRKFNDKGLLQREIRKTMSCKQEHSQCNIDENIANSRKSDLEEQKKMCDVNLQELLTEMRETAKKNMDLEYKLQGRGVTEAD